MMIIIMMIIIMMIMIMMMIITMMIIMGDFQSVDVLPVDAYLILW